MYDTSVLDAFAAYQRGKNLAETTIRNRHSILTTLATCAGASLLDVTVHDLRLFVGRKGIEPASRRTNRNAIVAFFAFAVAEGYRDDNPAARLDPVRVPRAEPRPFTREQIDAMLETGAYRRTRAMILLGYYQGFRVSQIARTHGHDIDLLANTIRTVGKGGKIGVLPLHPVIRELAEVMPRDGYWFPARAGRDGHVNSSSVTDLITKAKIRAGITDPKLTPHSLRHAFGTDLVEEGVDIRIVRDLMMHESLTSTEIYTALSGRRRREGMHALPGRAIPDRSGRASDGRVAPETGQPAAA